MAWRCVLNDLDPMFIGKNRDKFKHMLHDFVEHKAYMQMLTDVKEMALQS